MAIQNKIPPGSSCYRDGKRASYRERDSKGNETGRLICKDCYNAYYRYGSYEKPDKTHVNGNRFLSVRMIRGKSRKVIVDKAGDILNRNPTKEELKGLAEEPFKKQRYTKKQVLEVIRQFYDDKGRIPTNDDFRLDSKYPSPSTVQNYFGSWNNAIKDAELWEKRYNSTNTCYRCGKNFDKIGWNYPQEERDEKGNGTGKWDCPACWKINDPNSENNIVKSIVDSRTGNLDPDSSKAKGNLGERLTSEWKGVKILSIEYDNYGLSLDHSPDPELGIIQTKIAWYDRKNRGWTGNFRNEYNKNFDYVIFYCVSENGETIECTYIIPEEEAKSKTSFRIIKYRKSGLLYENGWYEKYRLKDEKEMKKINDIWKKILGKI